MDTMPIERGKIREYAVATGAARPSYLTQPRPVIPPTFLATVVFWHDVGAVLRSDEVLRACGRAGIEPGVSGMLSMGQDYEFFGPLPRAGDELRVSDRLIDVRETTSRGRPMVIVRFAVDFSGPGGRRASCTYTSAFTGREVSPAPGKERRSRT